MWKRFTSNALANVVAGASGMAFQLGVTAVATRTFDSSQFSVWALAFSMAALAPLFSANLATIVTRQLVTAATHGRSYTSEVVLESARQISLLLGSTALAFVAVTAWALQHFSPDLQSVSANEFTLITLLIALSQVWQISVQPSFGWHYARGQNWMIAFGISAARAGSLAGVVAACLFDPALWAFALCLAAGAWLGLAVIRRSLAAPRRAGNIKRDALASQRRETTNLLKGFAIWSLGSALIQYALPPIVSILGTTNYNAFYLAYSLNLIVVGIVGAVGSALLAPIARLREEGDLRGLVRLMKTLPAATGMLLVTLLFVLWLALPATLSMLTAGLVSEGDVKPYLQLLGFQTVARSIAVFFAVVLSAGGNPAQLARPILIELALTAFVAVPLGWVYGDRWLLSALATIGAIAAATTMWVTLESVRIDARSRIVIASRFVGIQALVATLWYLVTSLNVP